jgi:type IX secretion system PorP/SprF family membrane protein
MGFAQKIINAEMIKIKFNKLGLVLILLSLKFTPSQGQQNIQLTQYIFNSLSINPAYAGYKEDWYGQMALRKQWAGIEDAPKTGLVSIDGILDSKKKRTGIGLQLGSDRLGPQSSTSGYINYAYRLQLDADDTKRLSFGVGAGMTQYTIDYSKLNPIDGGDQYATQGTDSKAVPDFRFGVYYYSPKLYLGASVLDLFAGGAKGAFNGGAVAEGVVIYKRHLYLIGGLLLDINSQTKFRPSLLIKEDFKGPTSLDLNSMVIFNDKFWMGGSYRTGVKLWNKNFQQGQGISSTNSVAAVALLSLNNSFRIGYSYDYTTSSLNSIENGSHEITLGMTLTKKSMRILSPRFF